MAYIETHGGDCCGRYHLHCMGPHDINYERFDEVIDHLLNDEFSGALEEAFDEDMGEVYNFCGEITLTHYQITQEVKYKGAKMSMHEALAKMNWERVYAFLNPNTENKVYVLMKAGRKVSTEIKDE